MRPSARLVPCLVLLLLTGLAVPSPADAGPEGFDAEKAFYEGYFLEHELQQPEMALINYLKFLRAAPNHRYARKAAKFSFDILEPADDKRKQEFMTAYGHLLQPENEERILGDDGEVEEAPPWKPTTPDELMLARYRKAAAQGQRPLEVAQAEQRLGLLAPLWRGGDFIEATRIATRSYRMIALYRIAEMLERKDSELDALRKRLEVAEGFGDEAEIAVLRGELMDYEDAIVEASTEAGIGKQVSRLYPDALTSPRKYGFLALLVGLTDPTNRRFRGWPERARQWLRDQAIRPQMGEESVKLAVEAGRELQLIVDLLEERRPEKAKEEIRRLWTLITR